LGKDRVGCGVLRDDADLVEWLVLDAVAGEHHGNVRRPPASCGQHTRGPIELRVERHPAAADFEPTRQEHESDRHELLGEQVGAQPGVTAVGSSSIRLLANNVRNAVIDIEGFERGYPATHAATNNVGADFFAALSIPLKAGREFTASDQRGAPRFALIEEAGDRRIFGDASPIGQRIRFHMSIP